MSALLRTIVMAFAVVSCCVAHAAVDHRVEFDDSGIWNRNVQKGVEYGSIAIVVGGALWQGSDDRLGRTFWQAFDSGVFSSATAEIMKHVFTRARPSQTDDPDKWFQGSGHYSFPSGEVSLVAGAVAPFVFEYGHDYPAVYLLEGFTLYDMIARVKTQSHWQTDVIAGAAIGTGFGYLANKRGPFIVRLLPGGAWVGFHKSF